MKTVIGYNGRATLHEIDGDHFLILSYSLPTSIQKKIYTETLAYKSDSNGRIIDSVPVMESKKLEDHQKFMEKLKHDVLALH